MTSFPMPSAGISPIFSERLAAVANDRNGVLNIADLEQAIIGRNLGVAYHVESRRVVFYSRHRDDKFLLTRLHCPPNTPIFSRWFPARLPHRDSFSRTVQIYFIPLSPSTSSQSCPLHRKSEKSNDLLMCLTLDRKGVQGLASRMETLYTFVNLMMVM